MHSAVRLQSEKKEYFDREGHEGFGCPVRTGKFSREARKARKVKTNVIASVRRCENFVHGSTTLTTNGIASFFSMT